MGLMFTIARGTPCAGGPQGRSTPVYSPCTAADTCTRGNASGTARGINWFKTLRNPPLVPESSRPRGIFQPRPHIHYPEAGLKIEIFSCSSIAPYKGGRGAGESRHILGSQTPGNLFLGMVPVKFSPKPQGRGRER